MVEMLKICGIKYARTTVSIERFDIPEDWLRLPATCHHNNPRLIQLAEEFLKSPESGIFWQNTPRLFYLLGHSYCNPTTEFFIGSVLSLTNELLFAIIKIEV